MVLYITRPELTSGEDMSLTEFGGDTGPSEERWIQDLHSQLKFGHINWDYFIETAEQASIAQAVELNLLRKHNNDS